MTTNNTSFALRFLLLLLSLLTSAVAVIAQDAAPDFICTRSEAGDEILQWQNTESFCPTVMGTSIFRSASATGPYTLLVTLPDTTVTQYRDPNPTGEQRYYYLTYATDCADADAFSDTLDSFIPVTPDVRFVSVEDGGLRISWRPSPSPEVSGYVILEVTPAGIVPIDTVGEGTDYFVAGVPADELTSRQYRIAAIDACGNDSPQSRIVSATGLIASGGRGCDTDILLRGDAPGGSFILSEPVAGAELYASVNGAPFSQVPYTLTADGASIVYSDSQDGERTCFFGLTRLVAGDSVLTDTLCRTLTITGRLPPVSLYGMEYDEAGRLIVKYSVLGIADRIDEATLRYDIGNRPQLSVPLAPTDFSGSELIVPATLPQERGGVAILEFFDRCGIQQLTNPVTTINLLTSSRGGRVELDWLPPGTVDSVATLTFTVLRQLDDSTFVEIASGLEGLSFTDLGVSEGCYRIIGEVVPVDRDTVITFRSNVSCAFPSARVYLPNVFSPTADQPENRIFQPQFSTLSGVTDYKLAVYNRWGGLIFLTDDPFLPWAGEANGGAAPSGAYIYSLSFRQNGNLTDLAGVVQLLY